MSKFSDYIDTLCYGSIYSHIKNKNIGNTIPDRYAINRGRQYVMISTLMYLNTPTFLLSTFHLISNSFWLIYTIATFLVIFPYGYSLLSNKRVATICEKFAHEKSLNVEKANKTWLKFYYISFVCFFVSVLMKLFLGTFLN